MAQGAADCCRCDHPADGHGPFAAHAPGCLESHPSRPLWTGAGPERVAPLHPGRDWRWMIAVPTQAILELWFGTGLRQPERLGEVAERWFKPDPQFDASLRAQYEPLLAGVARETPWRGPIEERLARVLLLDQFSRNIHRGTARAFAYDGAAQALMRGARGRCALTHRALLFVHAAAARGRRGAAARIGPAFRCAGGRGAASGRGESAAGFGRLRAAARADRRAFRPLSASQRGTRAAVLAGGSRLSRGRRAAIWAGLVSRPGWPVSPRESP